jgi:hypothetical protein
MKALRWSAAAIILASTLQAQPRGVKATNDLLEKGSDLSARDAGELEEQALYRLGELVPRASCARRGGHIILETRAHPMVHNRPDFSAFDCGGRRLVKPASSVSS